MENRRHWTREEQAEVMALCQQNHESFLRLDFMLGVVRHTRDLSTKDRLFLVGLQIEVLDMKISELETILRGVRSRAKEGGHHD